MLVRFFLGIMWLIQCLPMAILAPLGRRLGALLYLVARERRHVTLTNLGLCFPQMSEAEKVALAKQHFAAFGRSFLERGLMWWASEERLKRVIRVEGMEYLRAQKGKPTLLFSPHFMGLDMAGTRIMMEMDCTSIYSVQKNKVFNDFLLKGRSRFGHSKHFSRHEGLRPPLRAMRQGMPFFYLSDLDYGPNEAIFVPFFAFHAATITGLSRLARMGDVTVMTVYGRMDADGWTAVIGAPWQNFPGESIEADTRRMNAELEGEMIRNPRLLPQYLWMHKRFKTRPEGEKRVY
jgi:KDO2-lipid IV(A) lauroyltransferase